MDLHRRIARVAGHPDGRPERAIPSIKSNGVSRFVGERKIEPVLARLMAVKGYGATSPTCPLGYIDLDQSGLFRTVVASGCALGKPRTALRRPQTQKATAQILILDNREFRHVVA